MTQLTVCLLTFNSMRTLAHCLEPARAVADELIVVDSGSSDGTVEFLQQNGIVAHYRKYDTHAIQMNHAVSLSTNDWVLCLDSDEFLDVETINGIKDLKKILILADPAVAWRLTRYWRVLGQEVRAIYPVSSPDNPVRLFHRGRVRFNDQPVDDKPEGFAETHVISGHVVHDTFFSVHELMAKLNVYTSRLVVYKSVAPSLTKAFCNPPFAFVKWYFRKGGVKDGAVGLVTAIYAAAYTFLKYLKAWCRDQRIP